MRILIFTLFLSTICLTNLFCQDNQCLDFNGNNNIVVVNGFDVSGDFTISSWFRCNATSNSSNDERILSFGPTTRLEIGIEKFTNKLYLYDQPGSNELSFGDDLRDGNWHHVIYVKSGIDRFVYLDGQEVGYYQALLTANYGANFRIGAWTGGSNTHTFFNGKVDDTKIWSVAKTSEELMGLIFCPASGDEEDLLAYWDFNQGVSAGVNDAEVMLIDRSPNDRDGVLTSNFELEGNTSNWVDADNSGLYYLDPSITQEGNELIANGNGVSYQWLNCDDNFSVIPGATSSTFTASSSGSYALEVSNFACAEISECLDLVFVNTEEVLKEKEIEVYPNPTNDFVIVEMLGTVELNVSIIDQLGNVLHTERVDNAKTKISLHDFPKGIYYLKASNIVRKIVKM